MRNSYPSETTKKQILAASGNQCAFPNCTELIFDLDHAVILGEIAHIKGRTPNSPRYDSNQSDSERNAYSNLIALCRKHHTLIDKAPLMYYSEQLYKWKSEHEQNIAKISDKNWIVFSPRARSIMTSERMTSERTTITFYYWIDKNNKPQVYTKEQLVKLKALRDLILLHNEINSLLNRITEFSGSSNEINNLQLEISKLNLNQYGFIGSIHEIFQIVHDLHFMDFTSINSVSCGKKLSRDTLTNEALKMIRKKVDDTPDNPHIERLN